MYWTDEGYLLSKHNFNENSIIIETFTSKHGKYTGIVYGGASRKQKRNFQIGNKILINWKAKGQNRPGYFNIELLKPISPLFFDDKKRSICIVAATSILRILLPERQINRKIYISFEKMLDELEAVIWIKLYIFWELSLIKELGFEINLSIFKKTKKEINNFLEINNKSFRIPKLLLNNDSGFHSKPDIKEALIFNKNLLMENFILPNNLKFPLFRNILEKYYS